MIFNREIRSIITPADKSFLEFFGIEVASDAKGKNALKIATVYACFRILTESVGKIPIKIYKDKKEADHYLNVLLKRKPNPFMTSFNFWSCMEFQRNLRGNAYAYIETRGSKVIALHPIDPTKVTIYIDTIGLTTKAIWYIVDVGNGEYRKVPYDEMLHFKSMSADGIEGIAPLDYLREILENGKSSQSYINKFYKNGMQTKGIIQYVGDLNSEAEKTFRSKFEQMSNGLDNAHRVSLLPIGYQYQPIAQKLVDAQFLENTKLTIQEISSAFGVKLHQINNLERATHSNIEQQQNEFYVDTMQPVLTMYEQEVTSKLLLDKDLEKGFYSKFNIDVILRTDLKTRYEAYRTGIQSGFLLPNEAREKEEMESQDGAGDLVVNGNMIKLKDVGKQYGLKGGENIE